MISEREIELAIEGILRSCALSGSDRQINMDQPIGEQGLGLDSLAMVEFVAALEKAFSIEISDAIWTNRDKLTPRSFVNVVMEQRPDYITAMDHHEQAGRQLVLASDSWKNKILREIRARGMIGGIGWFIGRLIANMQYRLYFKDTHLILYRDLSEGQLASFTPSISLSIREATVNDLEHVLSFWHSHHAKRNIQNFLDRIERGFICLSAWHGNELVGIDYLSSTGDNDPDTGLTINVKEGTCYALDLFEKYEGQGIGLALLSHSLADSHRRGFLRQVTFVRERNIKMLTVSLQLLGFKKCGHIESRRIFGRTFSVWCLNGRTGSKQIDV